MLVVSACSGSATTTTSLATTTAPPTTTSTTTTTVPPTTSTTESPSATVDPLARPEKLVSNFDRDSVDDFDTTGDNLWQVMLEIEDLLNFLEVNPLSSGEEMLGLAYGDSYPDRAFLVEAFHELAANDWHYIDAGSEIVAIEVDSIDDRDSIVRVASRRGDQLVADSQGQVVKTYQGWELDVLTYALRLGDDGRWRIADFLGRLSPVPQSVLDDMVPVEWKGRDS